MDTSEKAVVRIRRETLLAVVAVLENDREEALGRVRKQVESDPDLSPYFGDLMHMLQIKSVQLDGPKLNDRVFDLCFEYLHDKKVVQGGLDPELFKTFLIGALGINPCEPEEMELINSAQIRMFERLGFTLENLREKSDEKE